MAHGGPSSWHEFFSWPAQTLQRLRQMIAVQRVPDMVFTSTFSGLGTAEMAATMAHREMTSFFRPSSVTHYSACDSEVSCQSILCKMDCCHVFRDVKECFDSTVMQLLTEYVHERHEEVQQITDKVSRKARILSAGKEVCRFAADLLSSHPPQETAYCVKCNKMCKRFPCKKMLDSNSIWVEGGSGSPCYPWTPAAYGSQLRWLHPEVSPVYFAWLFSLLNAEPSPDAILHENVSGFDWESMKELVGSKYTLETIVVSPEDCGLPVARPRRFTASWTRQENLPTICHELPCI